MSESLKVAMKATQKQFIEELKPTLLKLGYDDITWGNWDFHCFLCIKTVDGKRMMGNYSYRTMTPSAITLDNYNAELFLALAAMSDEYNGVKGEYWVCKDQNSDSFTYGNLYKADGAINGMGTFRDNGGHENGYYPNNHGHFRKATVDEIIGYFEGPKQQNEPTTQGDFKVGDEVRVTNNCRWKTVDASYKEWHPSSYFNHFNDLQLFNTRLNHQFIFKIEGDLVYIDNKGYEGKNYIVIEKKNIELTNKNTKMKNRTLTPANAQRIINIACSSWKPKLVDQWAKAIVLGANIEISDESYKEMRNACTADQNKLFDEIFGKDSTKVTSKELNVGEAMIVESSGQWNNTIVLRTYECYVDVNNPKSTWQSPTFEGKRVKLTITHQVID